jgi:calcineurin-like phosphoesterase
VIHLLGQIFIKYQVNCPFANVEEIISNNVLGKDVDIVNLQQGLNTVKVAEAVLESANTGTTINII